MHEKKEKEELLDKDAAMCNAISRSFQYGPSFIYLNKKSIALFLKQHGYRAVIVVTTIIKESSFAS